MIETAVRVQPIANINHNYYNINSILNESMLTKGYECTNIFIDILRRGLKELRRYKAGAALKRKMNFLLFNTMKV